jgi:hypothetical protein
MSASVEKADGTLDSDLLPINYFAQKNISACSQLKPVCSLWKKIELSDSEVAYVKPDTVDLATLDAT